METGSLPHVLDRIDSVLRTDPGLAVKAFGILLLGRRFEAETEDESKDPTFAITGGKVGGLGSDEMIPRL